MNLLIVDEDQLQCSMVEFLLAGTGLNASVVSSLEEARQLMERQAFHMVAMEAVFNGSPSGFDFCRELRGDGFQSPIIFVSTKGDVEHKVAGLAAGADDYVPKPFEPRELVARVKAVLRRYGHSNGKELVAGGGLKLDVRELKATTARGTEVSLTRTETRLLSHLLSHVGETVSRESLLNAIWGFDNGDSNLVDVYIRRLRQKLERQPSHPAIIQTVWGVGYRLVG